MGWFKNDLTQNRVENIAKFIVSAELLKANLTIIHQASALVNEQTERGSRLMGQAFSVQGASSHLGKSLQSALNTLRAFKEDADYLSNDIDDRAKFLALLLEQFQIPRAQRSLNASGKEMTNEMVRCVEDSIDNLMTLKSKHEGPTIQSINTINRADEQLNGIRSNSSQNQTFSLRFITE